MAAGQLELTGGAIRFLFFFLPNPRKASIQLILEAQQHKKFAQTTPLDDGVSSLLTLKLNLDRPDVLSVFRSVFKN
jgi:hypothetical protein